MNKTEVNTERYLVRLGRDMLVNWHRLVLAISSLTYGVFHIFNPVIMNSFRVYEHLDNMFQTGMLPWIFAILGTVNIISCFTKSARLTKVSTVGLLFIWMLFSFAFITAAPINTVWIFATTMTLQYLGIILRM